MLSSHQLQTPLGWEVSQSLTSGHTSTISRPTHTRSRHSDQSTAGCSFSSENNVWNVPRSSLLLTMGCTQYFLLSFLRFIFTKRGQTTDTFMRSMMTLTSSVTVTEWLVCKVHLHTTFRDDLFFVAVTDH